MLPALDGAGPAQAQPQAKAADASPAGAQADRPKPKFVMLVDDKTTIGAEAQRIRGGHGLTAGHAWCGLEENGQRTTWGYWGVGFSFKEPWKSCPAEVRSPDTAHAPTAEHHYDIDVGAGERVKQHAAQVKASPGSYNLFRHNCVNFAVDMARAAGVAPPSFSTLGVANPDKLADNIRKMNAAQGEDGMERPVATAGNPPPGGGGHG